MDNDFKLIYYRHNFCKEAPSIQNSIIMFYELTIVISGELKYYCNNNETLLNSGNAVFIKPGNSRRRDLSKDNVNYVSFNFICKENFDSFPQLIKACTSTEIKLLIAACDEIYSKSFSGYEERISHILYTILLQLKNNLAVVNSNSLCLKIKQYIKQNLEGKVTLKDIGELTFFSPLYCDTLFRKETGKSIINYLIDERISEARRLLVENSLTLTSVAETVGFCDYNYFARMFKKRTGYTPTQYKKNIPDSFNSKKY